MSNQNSNVIPFNFNQTEVRTLELDELIWFVASDVARALGYRDAANLTRVLDEDEKGTHNMSTPCKAEEDRGTHIVRTPSREQEMAIINESGLYHALIKSRKPEAKLFRKWVTSEVLPAIRKHGRYETPATLTPEQQRHIQTVVSHRVSLTGNSHQTIYKSIKDHFSVGTYKDIPQEQYPALCNFLDTKPRKAIMSKITNLPELNVEQMMTEGLTDPQVALPSDVTSKLREKAYALSHEFYYIAQDSIERQIAYNCEFGYREIKLNRKRALKIIEDTTMDKALAQKLWNCLRSVENMAGAAAAMAQNYRDEVKKIINS